MSLPVTTEKVLAYVVRSGRLLVFRHVGEPWDESGLQVPAGTVEPGEDPASAALREAREETGLTRLRLVRKVGEMTYDMAPYRPQLQHRHVFQLAIDGDVPERWTSGEIDPDDGEGSHVFECYWIPLRQGHALAAGQGALLGLLQAEGFFSQTDPDTGYLD